MNPNVTTTPPPSAATAAAGAGTGAAAGAAAGTGAGATVGATAGDAAGDAAGATAGDAARSAGDSAQAAVDAAIASRRSIRAFLPTPVPRETVEAILSVAARAPSGTNTQPWRVYVLTGDAKTELSRKIIEAYDDPAVRATHTEEYDYYPTEWKSPFIERRRKVGWDLYSLLGIEKTDKARMHAQHSRNYDFFGAPVGLMFTIDRVMRQGSWLDYGMFLQSIMVAARGRGLDTCPQAAFSQFHRIIQPHIGAGPQEQLVCGMALGHADPAAVANRLVTVREPVTAFARFLQ